MFIYQYSKKVLKTLWGDIMAKMGGIVGGVVGIVIGIIMLINVLLPTTQDSVSTANVTGTASTILDLYPLFIVLGGFLLIVSLTS